MLKRSLWATALAAGLSSHAHAQFAQGQRMMLVDERGVPISAANALPISGGAGGSGGSVTAAGANGTQAQAVQGITGGVPQNVRIDQTTPGTTNRVSIDGGSGTPGVNVGFYSASRITLGAGGASVAVDKHAGLITSEQGSDDPLVGITPAITQAGTAVVGKASQGNLYSAYAVNTTATAGYLVCINAAAAPASGAAITPIDVATLGGAAGAMAQINYGAGPPNGYSTGIACLVTTSLTTYTPGGASFMQARVR